MGKKNAAKKGKLPASQAGKKNEKVTPPQQQQDEPPFDYGGLPNRDFKKNIGCG